MPEQPPTDLTPLDIPALLRRYSLRPHKGLGQNFLVDPASLHKVMAAADVGAGDTVLEIGPGLGSLTRILAGIAQKVVAVEIDAGFLPPLREVLTPYDNVTLVKGDILAVDLEELMGAGVYQVVANIPYNITSLLIRKLLESNHPPQHLTLTVQKEVAARLCAGPGDMSLLALSVQVYGSPKIMANIPAGAFYPAPNVDSAVVQVERYPQPRVPVEDLSLFFRLAKAGFSQKRKMLRNTLSAGMHWSKDWAEEALALAGIDPTRRAETVSLEEWGRLVIVVKESGNEK